MSVGGVNFGDLCWTLVADRVVRVGSIIDINNYIDIGNKATPKCYSGFCFAARIILFTISLLFPLRMRSRSWPQEHMVLQDLTEEVVYGKRILVLLEYLLFLDKYESVS